MSLPPRGRPPTAAEARAYVLEFPHLSTFSVTGEADASYDCVALTIKPRAPQRLEPSPALVGMGGLAALDFFYRQRRFSRVAGAPNDASVSCVAVFGLGGIPTHVALRDRHPLWWESKLGTGLRILHRLSGLEGGRYGGVIGYYASAERPGTSGPAAPSPEIA